MNIYQKWGFSANPFDVKEILGSKLGSDLLVGRKLEKEKIVSRIYNPPKCITIEGNNGIGKTSLINVSLFEIKTTSQLKRDSAILLPCNKAFQISEKSDDEEFIDYVYYNIAQTILNNKKNLISKGLKIEKTTEIDDFLNTYALVALNVGFGFSAGESIELNYGDAFNRSGFRLIVDEWLVEISSYKNGGFIICVIDNLELLRTSDNAKKRFEYLRDILFTKTGLRWLLSGSKGIFIGIASSPRLNGILFDPIEIVGLDADVASELFDSRINAFKKTEKPYLPITKNGCEKLVEILKGNIRHILHNIDEYCMWCVDHNLNPHDDEYKDKNLQDWLTNYSGKLFDILEKQVEPKGRKLFELACKLGRNFNYADFEVLGLNNRNEMSKYIIQLETIEMVFSYKKEETKRIEIEVAPKGLILSHEKF